MYAETRCHAKSYSTILAKTRSLLCFFFCWTIVGKCNSWKMPFSQPCRHVNGGTTKSFLCCEVPDELLCKFQTKIFQAPVFIPFLWFAFDCMIWSHLIIPVDFSHVFIVSWNNVWTLDCSLFTIFFSPLLVLLRFQMECLMLIPIWPLCCPSKLQR